MHSFLIGMCIGIYITAAIMVAATAPQLFGRQYLVKGIVGALWPLIGAVVLICLPFLAIGWLAEQLGNWARNPRK